MIARLTFATPFVMYVPDGGQFTLASYEEDGYEILARLPGKSNVPIVGDKPEDVTIDGKPAFAANALQIDFMKAVFDRRKGAGIVDPPVELIRKAVSSLVTRLRYVTRAAHVQPIDFPMGVTWRLQFLQDDGSELPEDPELVRGLGGMKVGVSFIAVSPDIWDKMFELDPDFVPPVWDSIYLDALNNQADIGTSIVLAATALEVFIADILDRLQQLTPLPESIWLWINDRDNWLKEPSPDEQFDVMLKHFTGHSLKQEPTQWAAFKNLREARNKFVHEGQARIGAIPVDSVKARQLLASTGEIIAKVREWLPPETHWPDPKAKAQLRFAIPLLRSSQASS